MVVPLNVLPIFEVRTNIWGMLVNDEMREARDIGLELGFRYVATGTNSRRCSMYRQTTAVIY